MSRKLASGGGGPRYPLKRSQDALSAVSLVLWTAPLDFQPLDTPVTTLTGARAVRLQLATLPSGGLSGITGTSPKLYGARIDLATLAAGFYGYPYFIPFAMVSHYDLRESYAPTLMAFLLDSGYFGGIGEILVHGHEMDVPDSLYQGSATNEFLLPFVQIAANFSVPILFHWDFGTVDEGSEFSDEKTEFTAADSFQQLLELAEAAEAGFVKVIEIWPFTVTITRKAKIIIGHCGAGPRADEWEVGDENTETYKANVEALFAACSTIYFDLAGMQKDDLYLLYDPAGPTATPLGTILLELIAAYNDRFLFGLDGTAGKEEDVNGSSIPYYDAFFDLNSAIDRTLIYWDTTPCYEPYCAVGSILDAGDFDGDGTSDLLIGDGWETIAWVIPGPVSGELEIEDVATASFTWGAESGDYAAVVGDVDGDGLDDVVVSLSVTGEVGVFLFSGGLAGELGPGEATANWSDPTTDYWLLYRGRRASDLNGDGYLDLALSTHDEDIFDWDGAVYVEYGPFSGDYTIPNADGLIGTDQSAFGWSTAALGDLDGDGRGELAIGAPDYTKTVDWGPGKVYVVPGPISGTNDIGDVATSATTDGDGMDGLGEDLAVAADFDGDGLNDLIAGASGDADYGEYSGAVWVYPGATLLPP